MEILIYSKETNGILRKILLFQSDNKLTLEAKEMGYIIEVEADELTKLYNLLEKNNNEEFEFLKSIENILSPYKEMPFYFFTEYLNNNKINHYRFWFS